ncbi:MAG: formate dehydrogenase accessory sulfurtransferase FdhD [Methanomicrobiaceae archaeon]|uniref:Formate dehydrogenase chain d n=1 Tax=hydrocarbon metagenome TaxID=938273 RepID=A0A0W8FHQ2_9ZZZZ|nr:formate dehydrogenase accessory sulfurtransferase FdhD [Methanomicrobiaceae archaeon]
MYRAYPCVRGEAGRFASDTHAVVEEAAFTLNVNGRNVMAAMVSPVDLEDFIVGYLFTEEIIKGPGEIESIKIEKSVASVLTTNPFRVTGRKRVILSGCGGSAAGIDPKKLKPIESDLILPYDAITDCIREVMASDLHRLIGGIHSVGLAGPEGMIRRAEDIGRHNAFDRVIGYALRNGIDRSRTFAVSSGRISSETVRKCLVANIPVIASRGASTSLALDIAEWAGLCVIGFVRGEKMNIYTRPWRVEGAGDVAIER